MVKVTIKDWGMGSGGVWLLVNWPCEGTDFLHEKFLSAKAINPKWKKGDALELPKSLLK